MEWRPIETRPQDMGTYLFLCSGVVLQGFMDATGALCVCQEDGGKRWRNMRRKPTHWMPPLQPPPN